MSYQSVPSQFKSLMHAHAHTWEQRSH